ncbi:MAG: class I SAM-dependent methyltransferase [Acidobacteria bacterium]|jgi:2-polyprenyl-3-methyl-5-hydroxy-6-metoxy-1,4-benzoquinol methylase|nr:class I SAM-dependent methyltransferase [Acidobacteriota bacterium]
MMQNIYLYSDTIKEFFSKGRIKEKYLLELKVCPVCESSNWKRLFQYYGFQYYSCKGCSFVFANPRLNDEGSKVWYNSDYYNAAIEMECYRVENGSKYASSSELLYFEKSMNLMEKEAIDRNTNIIEIGCGGGAFGEYLREKNFTSWSGIDLNQRAVDFATNVRKLHAGCININDLNINEKAGLIVAMEIIEHANDINGFMTALRKHIAEKGYLLITAPYNDKRATFLGGVWGDHYMAPNHINFFNLKSITHLLSRHDFEIKDFFILDSILNPFGLIRSRAKFKMDWATSLPPVMVQPGVKIPKNESDHFNYVIHDGETINKSVKTKIKNKIKAKILNFMNLRVKYHLIILARDKKKKHET